MIRQIKPLLLVAGLLFAFQVQAQQKVKTKGVKKLESKQDSISYAIGANIGGQIGKDYEVNFDALAQGMADGLAGEDKMLDENQLREVMNTFQQEMQRKVQERKEMEAVNNQKKGEEFLAENKDKPGVKSHESGMQYKVLKAGTGASPTVDNTVKIHYKGTLIDGTEFDSSYSRGEPATFPLKNLIKGWQIAVTMMKEGGKWELYLPADLAYGQNGPPSIGPNQVLIFTIELLEVVK